MRDKTSEKYIKNFDAWNEQCKIIDQNELGGFSHAREVWWCALGVNIGSEQDGKNESFERPVLIIRHVRENLVLVAPISSQIKDYPDRVTAYIVDRESQILLSQIRTVSTKRLLRSMGQIKVTIFYKVIFKLLQMIFDGTESETPL